MNTLVNSQTVKKYNQMLKTGAKQKPMQLEEEEEEVVEVEEEEEEETPIFTRGWLQNLKIHKHCKF